MTYTKAEREKPSFPRLSRAERKLKGSGDGVCGSNWHGNSQLHIGRGEVHAPCIFGLFTQSDPFQEFPVPAA